MKSTKKVLTSLLLGLVYVSLLFSQGKHTHGTRGGEELGTVNFPITVERAETQESFNRGVALLHSFVYDDAVKAFTDITLLEPQCAMAYWGIAMSYFHPLWESPGPEEIQKAWAAIQKAKYVGGKTERERDYIAAIESFFKDADKVDHRTRALAYEKAMEQIYLKYPDDGEAAVFYALSLNATALKTDKTYANYKRAGEILQKAFDRQPNHPGIAHYIIHSYDSPPLARLALSAAQRYAKIAPSAPHALHMPSHIFVRLGLWQDNIETNIASAKAGEEKARKINPDFRSFDALHAWDYMTYGYLQGGQDKEARRLLEVSKEVKSIDRPNFAAAYALAAIPVRYALERRSWTEAAALMPSPAEFPWSRFPWAEALTHFARTLGAARSGDPSAARKNAERLQSLFDASVALKETYWANQVEILQKAAAAWIALAEGNAEEGLTLMRAAAHMEDATDKHPVTPGSVLPQRELLGDFLLELNKPAEALKEYETSLASAPNRYNSLYGAARTSELSGNGAQARAYYAKLLEICANADTGRPELQAAKKYLVPK